LIEFVGNSGRIDVALKRPKVAHKTQHWSSSKPNIWLSMPNPHHTSFRNCVCVMSFIQMF